MLHADFVAPRYGGGCFAEIPQTIRHLLTRDGTPGLEQSILGDFNRRYDTVIFLFIDSFGWRFLEEHLEQSPFLQRLLQNGKISQITSQFPSTTAAHVTSIHTGLPVGQSGIYEWQYYEPLVDAVIAPLLFSFAGTRDRETLTETGISPAALSPDTTFYRNLADAGIQSFVFQNEVYTPSPYSDVVFDGATVIPYMTLPEALTDMHSVLATANSPKYLFLYFEKIDSICHVHGPDSPEVAAEIQAFLAVMEYVFMHNLSPQAHTEQKKTLLMMSADHGQMTVDPATTIYLNQDQRFEGIVDFMRKDNHGNPIVPAGSCRDFFLYIKDDRLDDAQSFLADPLSGVADVVRIDQLLDWGFFGAEPLSQRFLDRVGNLVLLPYENQSIWWYERGKFDMKYRGMHGGLSRAEMEIPFALMEL